MNPEQKSQIFISTRGFDDAWTMMRALGIPPKRIRLQLKYEGATTVDKDWHEYGPQPLTTKAAMRSFVSKSMNYGVYEKSFRLIAI